VIKKFDPIQYNEKGYFVLESFFSKREIDEICNEIPNCIKVDAIKTIYEDDEQTVRSLMSYHNKNDMLNKYTRDPIILEIVESVLGEKVYVSQSKINLKKGKKGKKWDYHRGFTFWNLLDGKPRPNMISVFICLSKQTIENGAVYVLDKSHKEFDLEIMRKESDLTDDSVKNDTSSNLSIQIQRTYIEQYTNKYKKSYLLGNPGDVFLMNPCLLHASDDNKSNKSRDIMITVYNSINNLPTKQTRPNYLCERDFQILLPFKGF